MTDRIKPLLDCLAVLKARGPVVVLETGTIRNADYEAGDGHSTRYIAERLDEKDLFYSIDLKTDVCDRLLRDAGLRQRVQLIESDSVAFLRQFDQGIHLAYLDSENSAELILEEFRLVYPLVRPGGFIVIDDAYPDSRTIFKCHAVKKEADRLGMQYDLRGGQMVIWKPLNFIKVWGIERSGTVYTQHMSRANIASTLAMSNGFGWKHGPVQDPREWVQNDRETSPFFRDVWQRTQEDGIGAVIVVKNPYDWWGSIERYAARFAGYQPFDAEWQYRRYNDLYLGWWRDLIQGNHPYYRRCIVLHYEALLRDPRGQLERLAGVAQSSVLEQLTIPRQVPMSGPWNRERERAYLEGIPLDNDKIALVNRLVSDEFFHLYGYERRNAK